MDGIMEGDAGSRGPELNLPGRPVASKIRELVDWNWMH